ncbi:hypothetical protein ACIBSV_10030 [Embleya sp. NPDC050154]|uniref:hypothetical protein n=1 Tax=Embleya sp. NPDC050154 TaxID=3363988 RepID=UPI0037942053
MSARRFGPYVPGRPVHVPRETFRPFLPLVDSVDLQDVPHPHGRPSWSRGGTPGATPQAHRDPGFDT